jgi:carbon monoxide dehydrogenase subunit G
MEPFLAGIGRRMGDYERSTTVDASRDELFEYLSKVENLPKYMDRMSSARPVTGDEVEVEAKLDAETLGDDAASGDEQRTVHGEAWFRVDADNRSIAWGAEGPHDYHGEVSVTGDESSSTVTVRLHTLHEDDHIEDGIDETLANIRRLTGAPTP